MNEKRNEELYKMIINLLEGLDNCIFTGTTNYIIHSDSQEKKSGVVIAFGKKEEDPMTEQDYISAIIDWLMSYLQNTKKYDTAEAKELIKKYLSTFNNR